MESGCKQQHGGSITMGAQALALLLPAGKRLGKRLSMPKAASAA
jgi:hypothetical protein